MGVVFVDGNLTVTTGTLYTRSISARSGNLSDNATIITPPDGEWKITEDTGSIFDTYYVRGDVSVSGIIVGDVVSVLYKHRFTVSDYEKGKEQICYILNHIKDSVLEEYKNILYQQQFASVISLMEHYLSCSFVGSICNNEESYHAVLQSNFLQKRFGHDKAILDGPDCIKKELLFIDLAKRIVYHNQKNVKELFEIAFGINVDLSPLESQLNTRHDIIHRFGYNDSLLLGGKVNITYDSVKTLMSAVDTIIHDTQSQLPLLPSGGSDMSIYEYLLGN